MAFVFLLFLDGILTFISPCILPLLPVYLSYFLRVENGDSKNKSMKRMLYFILGFSLVFILMGVLATSMNQWLLNYRSIIQLISGLLIIIAGLHTMQIFHLPALNLQKHLPQVTNHRLSSDSFLFLFGALFALGWTPCMSMFLGTALLLAAQSGSALTGGFLLFVYSLGLAIPFILTTYFIESFKDVFQWIKTNYQLVNRISGILLIITGILMATGWINYLQLFVS